MRTYSFEKRTNESIYEYLYKCIKEDILLGILSPNEKLPSKRTFAENHGVSIVTVENTYGQLQAEGYIYSKPKSGFYVSPIQGQMSVKSHQTDLISTPQADTEVDIINLTHSYTKPEDFPFSIWAKITRKILADQNPELLKSPPAGGVMELRLAIAKHLSDFRGINVSPEQIIVGAGSEYLYSLIVQLFGRDKIYGLENPCSKKIRSIYTALGAKVSPLAMDQDGILLTPENLTVPDIIQISPSHHFPTGIVTSISRRYGLLQWANESDNRYIIEDDYDSELRLQGKPIPSLFSIDASGKVIYFNTFTKSLASTVRISYMVLPKTLLDTYQKKLGFYSCTVSNLLQYELAYFIRDNYFEKHIYRMRNQYRMLRDTLLEGILSSPLATKVDIKEENAGLHFLLKINTEVPDSILKEKAREKGVNLSFLSDYYSFDYTNLDESYAHTAVINYSGLSNHEIPLLVDRLNQAWN